MGGKGRITFNSKLLTPHSQCPMPHAPYPIPHAPYPMPQSEVIRLQYPSGTCEGKIASVAIIWGASH
ncbi:hypothetical protein [Nostoc linckia]|uniref:hypothetical protein n=1 Tax=Nostoc linckia TaxID=92942 RepID=UPI00117FC57C|nr:hypothetical protein [Nostoc linckia]